VIVVVVVVVVVVVLLKIHSSYVRVGWRFSAWILTCLGEYGCFNIRPNNIAKMYAHEEGMDLMPDCKGGEMWNRR